MLYQRFQLCIQTLIEHSDDALLQNKLTLTEQKSTLMIEQSRRTSDLKTATMNSVKSNASFTDRISQIKNGDLKEYQTNLRLQKQKGLSSKSSLLTISRIMEKNKEIDRINSAIKENDLKLSLKAKQVANLIKNIDSINQEILLMDDALQVSSFLVAEGVVASELVDYEVARLYNTFSTEV